MGEVDDLSGHRGCVRLQAPHQKPVQIARASPYHDSRLSQLDVDRMRETAPLAIVAAFDCCG